jgi:hypothetical protein
MSAVRLAARWGVALALGLVGCAAPGVAEDQEHRAGYPSEVACWAQPSDSGHYFGYAVGGGSPCRCEGPYRDERTWGWDYEGLLLPSWVALLWSHGRQQGGTGAYRTDGPRPVESLKRGTEGCGGQ